ncbi:MAG: hypothetical protein M1368_00650 [Thaumarchaeota archaeon]|nr:hypothetical protein [Nitrososphaerota archaeon]
MDGLIVMVFGFILMSLGNMDTFFKVNTDIIVDGMAENFQHEEQNPEITNQLFRIFNVSERVSQHSKENF